MLHTSYLNATYKLFKSNWYFNLFNCQGYLKILRGFRKYFYLIIEYSHTFVKPPPRCVAQTLQRLLRLLPFTYGSED